MANTCSRTTAIPKYLPKEEVFHTTASRLQQTNITQSALDHFVNVSKETRALVVVARTYNVTHWMDKVHSDWDQYTYLVSEDTSPNDTLHVPANVGNEAMRYLSFLIDRYDSLPDIIAFRHGHENSWHQTFDSAAEVNNLNLTTIRLRRYQNFQCGDSCSQHIYLAETQRNEERKKLLSTRSDPPVDAAIYEHWNSWFGVPMPEDVAAACCAQSTQRRPIETVLSAEPSACPTRTTVSSAASTPSCCEHLTSCPTAPPGYNPSDVRDLLTYIRTCLKTVDHHHHVELEETVMFPKIEAMAGDEGEGLFSGALHQHRQFHDGLDELLRVAESLRAGPSKYSWTTIKANMDNFAPALVDHLRDKINLLLLLLSLERFDSTALSTYWKKAEDVAKVNGEISFLMRAQPPAVGESVVMTLWRERLRMSCLAILSKFNL
ncbi:MAG: hypothetical protein ASARMPREDX12_002099 [Alectoria sarmentosa]|nr:MAG: hypothetical protein ASARMPREDX12_002099 [Alectoria sarmentosa]